MDSKRAETQHVSQIVSIGGSKGGVGKSMTTIAALDRLWRRA
jgi:MinD superfamily P-loop ATPase